MFDLSWTEILVIGTAAIIFIGPKELPGALKTLGQWAAKARTLANEFRSNVDEMIRESELEKLKSQMDNFTSGNLAQSIEKTVDPKGEIASALTPPDFPLEGPPVEAPKPASPVSIEPPPPPASTPVATETAPDTSPPSKPAV